MGAQRRATRAPRALAAYLAHAVLAVVALPAEAGSRTDEFVVERSEAANACPSAEALRERVAVLAQDEQLDFSRLRLHISVDREPRGQYVAHLEATHQHRELRAPGPGCAGLADSLALAVLLILDQADGGESAIADTEPLRSAERLPAAEERGSNHALPSRTVAAGRKMSAFGGGAGGVTMDVLGSSSTTALLGAAVSAHRARLQAGLSLLWLGSRQAEYESGSLHLNLAALRLAACGDLLGAGGFELGPCGSGVAGLLSATARGFYAARTVRRPYWLLGAGVFARRRLADWLWLRGAAHAFAALNREELVVAGVGSVYRTASSVETLEFGLDVRFW